MPYIGRAATNTGSVRYLDNIASGFDGSDTTFTAQVGGVNITPDQENVEIYLDGVFQHPGSGNAYTISGSTITFTEAPVANTVFTGYVVGAGAYLDDKAVSSAKLDDDAVTAAKLDDDGTGFQVGDLGVGGSLTSGDKLTVTGRARVSGGIIGDLTGDVTGTASIATTVTITDNESTNEDNAVIFTAGGDVDGGNLGLESDGNLTYNPSTGRLTATQLAGTLQTAAQTNITSVGTLSSLTTSGSAGSAYVGSFTNTSATGWGLFVKGGADNADYTLRVQDKDAGDLLSVKAGGRIGVNTNDPGAILDINGDTSTWDGMAKIYLTDVNSNSSSRNWSIGNGGTAYGALSFIVSNAEDGVPADSTGTAVMSMDGVNKRIGIGTASPANKLHIFSDASGVDNILEIECNATNASALLVLDSHTDRDSGVYFQENGNWKGGIFNDASEDATVIMDGSNNNTMTLIGNNATFAGNITQSASGNLRLTQTAGGSGESSLVLTANNSTGDSFVRWETNSTTFCLGLDNSDGDKFILSAGSDPHSNSVINIQPDGSSIAVDKPTSFGSRIDFTGSPNMGNRVHSVQVASGASSTYNMNGAGGNCSGGFIVGACHRDTSTTADNSVIIMAHLHTQGTNSYSTILERNDDSDVTIARSGGNLTCTNNGNSTVNFIVKYILLTGFIPGSNNLR